MSLTKDPCMHINPARSKVRRFSRTPTPTKPPSDGSTHQNLPTPPRPIHGPQNIVDSRKTLPRNHPSMAPDLALTLIQQNRKLTHQLIELSRCNSKILERLGEKQERLELVKEEWRRMGGRYEGKETSRGNGRRGKDGDRSPNTTREVFQNIREKFIQRNKEGKGEYKKGLMKIKKQLDMVGLQNMQVLAALK